ncbi:MAG TPA: hypothetical protein VMI54_05030 [Polyangiaceae bacterium]|nr:hypothetical protein [Polyangiaceae bacterium]
MRRFGADRRPCDAMAEVRMGTRDLDRVTGRPGRQTLPGHVEPAEHDRERIRHFVQGAG